MTRQGEIIRLNSDKKKNTGKLFFDEESIYEISKP